MIYINGFFPVQQVTTRIDFTLDAIDVSGRTIALDHKSEQEAISAIWSALSYSLTAVENIKRNWKNLDFEVGLILF